MVPLFLSGIFASDALSQEHHYPTRAAPEGSVVIKVTDRYRLPVSRVTVKVVEDIVGEQSQPYGRSVRLSTYEPAGTDSMGQSTWSSDPGRTGVAFLSRLGYAPKMVAPIQSGHSYDVTLDLGSSIRVVCRTEDSEPVPDTRVQLHWIAPKGIGLEEIWPHGNVKPLLVSETDGTGEVDFSHLPVGAFQCRAYSSDGRVGVTEFSIANAFGNEYPLAEPHEILMRDAFACEAVVSLAAGGAPDHVYVEPLSRSMLRLSTPRQVLPKGTGNLGPFATDTIHALKFDAEGCQPAFVPIASVQAHADAKTPLKVTLIQDAAENVSVDFRKLPWNEAPNQESCFVSCDYPSATRASSRWTVTELTETTDPVMVRGVPSQFGVIGAFANRSRSVFAWMLGGAGKPLELVRTGSIDVKFSVGGAAPHAAYVYLRPIVLDPRFESRPLECATSRIELTSETGMVRFASLVPGRYRVEPHFHYAVFMDYSFECDVSAGEQVALEREVRVGESITVHLKGGKDASYLQGMLGIRSLGDPLYSMDTAFSVTPGGSAMFSGLTHRSEYVISYQSIAGSEPRELVVLKAPFPKSIELDLK